MWPWSRRRDRFSLEELRYLIDQLQRASSVNDLNKESVVETLRSIAELMIWGDQHDPAFFEYFMEKQVMVLFLHILKFSSSVTMVAVQLLQSLSIMIQNLHSEHAIYYIFSNGYLDHFITYPYDFQNEELLAYYISFLRTISTKLDRTTASFFIKTEGDEVVSFPLYTEGIKFFRHEESMVRIAVRALTLNVYKVAMEDDTIRAFVTSTSMVGYVKDLVEFLIEKSDHLVAHAERFEEVIAETEEILDYCNDIIRAGIPELSHAMTDNLLQLYALRLFCLFDSGNGLPALHSLARILNIVRHKPLANGIAAAIICESALTGPNCSNKVGKPNSNCTKTPNGLSAPSCPRKTILSCIVSGNDELAFMSVVFLLAVLHSEVDDSLLDLIGLLPRVKQHKRRLLQTLMGNNADEELLFSSFSDKAGNKNAIKASSVPQVEMKEGEEVSEDDDSEAEPTKEACCDDVCDSSFRTRQIVEKLLEMLCVRPPPSSSVLYHAGALLWQIFPEKQDNVHAQKLEKLRDAYLQSKDDLLKELDDCWCDVIPSVVSDEWKSCRKALECLPGHEGPAFLRISRPSTQVEGRTYGSFAEDFSSSAVAERMQNTVKVFVILHQIQQLCRDGSIREDIFVNTKSKGSRSALKVGKEMDLSGSVPCRIAFERGKEREVYLTPTTEGNLGWLILAEAADSKPGVGMIRVVAPLSGCLPEIDEDHPRWLHLRIRPPGLPTSDTKRLGPTSKTKRVDGRWTLAFSDVESCKEAKLVIEKELSAQKSAVLEQLRPLLSD